MKICATVAEYNPLHNGHLKHIEYIKSSLKADKLIVLLSGNFTQRGEMAVLDKFIRAKHAIFAGADLVIEIPTVFATANAEIFCKGAIKLLSDLKIPCDFCFGVENGNVYDYINLASLLNDENDLLKEKIKENLKNGISLAKAKSEAIKSITKNQVYSDILSKPNNILGIEYVKAIYKLNANIKPVPMIRFGDHNDVSLKENVTSATSIREALKNKEKEKIKGTVPDFVYNDLNILNNNFENMALTSLIKSTKEQLKDLSDCTEGLENRIKDKLKFNLSLDGLINSVATKRYPITRIKRIITANLLGIKKDMIFNFLSAPLYAKILAVKKSELNLLTLLSENSDIPLLTRKSDLNNLSDLQKECFNIDVLANDIYNLANGKTNNENQMIII